MGSFKQLKSSDVITVPVIANKTWNFNYCPLPYDDPYITVYNGTNYTNSFNPGSEPITNTHYDRLTYRQINQLFYHQYSGSLNTASLASSIHYISASSQHPSASFFNFNNDPAFISYFPTGANETIRVIQISPKAYGNKVLPYSFQMSSSNYNFYDDGKGNIYDNLVNPSPTHAGNIFYSEGTVVITNQNYQNAFVLPAVAYDDAYSIVRNDYPNPLTFSFYPLTNDDLRGNTLINNSIQIFGGNANFFSTGSNNSVSLSFSGLGTGVYQTFYTFLTTGSYCAPLMSSTGSITVNVSDPECEFEIGIIIPPPFPPALSVSPTPTRTVTPTPTRTVTPTVTPSKTISITPSVTPTRTPTVTPTPSPSTNYEFRVAQPCCSELSEGVIAVPIAWGEGFITATNGYCYKVGTLVAGPATLTWNGGTLYADCETCGAANPCPSPSPSVTPSKTPSITPSLTLSPTPTPSPSLAFRFIPTASFYILDEIDNTTSAYIYGNFESYSYNNTTSPKLIKLNQNLTVDSTFNVGTGFNSNLYGYQSITQQSDGKIIATGDFTSYSGSARNRIIRINTDGTIDNTFNIGTGFSNIALGSGIDSAGKIIVAGLFGSYSGSSTPQIARINTNGTLDATFIVGTGFNQTAIDVLVNTDDSIIVTGYFNSYSGSSVAPGITKLSSSGIIDTSFNAGAGLSPYVANNANGVMRITGETSFYAFGYFTSYSGSTANRIVKINSNGTIDGSFSSGTGLNGNVGYGKVIFTNKLLLYGTFTSYNGTASNELILLNSDGTIYQTFTNSYKGILPIGNKLYGQQINQPIELIASYP